MRPRRLLLPLSVLTLLALASPAFASDATVRVIDFEFVQKNTAVEVGDTVTWSFEASGHTTTADSGQPESWSSAGPNNETNQAGTAFAHTFKTPGRYSYICIPHQAFMKGVVTVGSDRFARSYSRFRRVVRGNKVIFNFTLREPARVVAKLSGAERRSVTKRRLRPGPHSIAFARLEGGSYSGTVTFTDDFDKKTVAHASAGVG